MAATALEYDWRPDGGFVRAMLADRHLGGAYESIRQFERTVVSHEGTRERWETRWLVRTDLSPKDALALFESKVPAAKGWKRDASAAASATGGARTVWRLRDDKGQAWTATGTFETAPGKKGRLLVSVRIVRGEGAVSS